MSFSENRRKKLFFKLKAKKILEPDPIFKPYTKKKLVLKHGKFRLLVDKPKKIQPFFKDQKISESSKAFNIRRDAIKKKFHTKGTKRWREIEGRITKKFAKGTRPWIGPYPSPLGDDLILSMEIIIAPDILAQNKMVTTMHDIYHRLRIIIYDLINQYTPKDTGLLRRSMKKSISERNTDLPKPNDNKATLKMWLFAEPDYAGIVNRMNTNLPPPHVRHPPYAGNYRVGKSGILLNDPTAIGHYYDFILLNARKKAKEVVEIELRILAKNLNMLYGTLKRLFRLRYK